MISGNFGTYHWVVWNSPFPDDLVESFPEIVLGKYVIVTSFDSGILRLTNDELQRGWRVQDGLAYSPPILEIASLPRDQYDEWYVFTQPVRMEACEVFINYSGFRLQDDASDQAMHELLERFWQQLQRLAPESYLAEGANLIFVTRNTSLFERVRHWKVGGSKPE